MRVGIGFPYEFQILWLSELRVDDRMIMGKTDGEEEGSRRSGEGGVG